MSISKPMKQLQLKVRSFFVKHKKGLISCGFFLAFTTLFIILYTVSRYFPKFVYKYYTTGLFKIVTFVPKLITKYLPFVFSELLLVVFLLVIFFFTGRTIYKVIIAVKKKFPDKSTFVLHYFAVIFKIVCVLISLFILLGAFNYNSMPVADIMGYEITKTDTKVLTELCNYLKEKTADSYIEDKQINRDVILDEVTEAYDTASQKYTFLKKHIGFTNPPKAASMSTAMCYLQISGIYPYLVPESIVNGRTPVTSLPHTACHEIAHQLGFAREDEANYIAYLVCINSDMPIFVYSGYYEAFSYAMNTLYRYDYEAWFEIYKTIPEGIIEDMKNENEFWNSFKTPNDFVSNISSAVNDAYLNANNVPDGIHSYGRMVDLLIADYIKNNQP